MPSRAILLTALILTATLQTLLPAAVINVPADFLTIQEAIDAATDGDEIIVAEGTYEQIRFNGKNLNIHSTDPLDMNVVRNTIIKPGLTIFESEGSVVIFSGSEDETCRLAGFTITRGLSSYYNGESGANGSGIRGHGCRATIEHNFIFENVAIPPTISERWQGGGIYDCDGLIQNNIIDSNFANQGAGLYGCDGVIQNNIITRNISRKITNNNPPVNIPAVGGALDSCNGVIQNNTIINNFLSGGDPTIFGGLRNCQGTIVNNIIWHTSEDYQTIEFDNNTTPSFCIIKDWTGGGEGNSGVDPLLTKIELQLNVPPSGLVEQDYRLHPDSPAIDSGKSTDSLTVDFEGNVRGFNWPLKSGGDGSSWDIGAHEFTTTSLNLWIPNRPLEIESGTNFDFHWLAYGDAGETIRLALYRNEEMISELGQFSTPMLGLIWTSNVQIPDNLPLENGYSIVGASLADEQITAKSHPFALVPRKTGANGHWILYADRP